MSFATTTNGVAALGPLPNWNFDAGAGTTPRCILTAASEQSGAETPVENTQIENLWQVWRSTTAFRHHARIEAIFSQRLPLGCLALGGCNLSPGGKWRVRVGDVSHQPQGRTRLAPNAVLTQTNLTGSLSDITDNPASPGGTHMEATGSAVLHVGFATPSNFEPSCKGAHSFRLALQSVGGTTNGNMVLTSCALYESGALRRELMIYDRATSTASTIRLKPDDDVLYEFPFDPTDLADTTGANLELRLTFSPGDAASARVRAVDLEYQQTLPSTGYWDSGLVYAWTQGEVDEAGGSLLAAVHPSEQWSRERTFFMPVTPGGLFADFQQAVYWTVEFHDPHGRAYTEVALIGAGPLVPFLQRRQASWGAEGRSVASESAGGRDTATNRRGRAILSPEMLIDGASVRQVYRWLYERPSGYAFVYAPKPLGGDSILMMPRWVRPHGELPALQVESGSIDLWRIQPTLRAIW